MLGKASRFFRTDKLLTVLDIGTTKVSCLIARLHNTNQGQEFLYGRNYKSEILAFGVCYYEGDKGFDPKLSVMPDKKALERAIRKAVDCAENQAGIIADSVIVNFSSHDIESIKISVATKIESIIRKSDIDLLLKAASQKALVEHRDQDCCILHVVPVGFRVDGLEHIGEPIGCSGLKLQADFHVIKAKLSLIQNLECCINRAHLTVESFVFSAYASGLAVLTDDEARLGAICVDLGSGVADISVFAHNRFFYGASLFSGGRSLTYALAEEFSLSLKEAESLKIRYGSLLESALIDHRFLPYRNDFSDNQALTYEKFNQVILKYNQDLLYRLREKIKGFDQGILKQKNVILTGAGAQLPGITDFYKKHLGLDVRIGRPLGMRGLNEEAKGPAFSTLAGLLVYPQANPIEDKVLQIKGLQAEDVEVGRFERVGRWLKENF